jgi:hypothetical protein
VLLVVAVSPEEGAQRRRVPVADVCGDLFDGLPGGGEKVLGMLGSDALDELERRHLGGRCDAPFERSAGGRERAGHGVNAQWAAEVGTDMTLELAHQRIATADVIDRHVPALGYAAVDE